MQRFDKTLLTADVWMKERIQSRVLLIQAKEKDIARIQKEITECKEEIKFYEEELGRYNSGKQD